MSTYADELYEALGPLAWADADNAYALRTYSTALALLFDQVSEVVHDQADGTPGWAILLDPERCPSWALGWLACVTGVRLPAGADEDQQRAIIAAAPSRARGKPSALVAAAQLTLTGGQHVYLVERDGSAYRLSVATYASETPSPAATLAALQAAKPAGLVLTYSTEVWDYTVVRAGWATYTALVAAVATYDALLAGGV